MYYVFCCFQCQEGPRFYLSVISLTHSRLLSLFLTLLSQIFRMVLKTPITPSFFAYNINFYFTKRKVVIQCDLQIFSYLKIKLSLFIFNTLLSQVKDTTIFSNINCMTLIDLRGLAMSTLTQLYTISKSSLLYVNCTCIKLMMIFFNRQKI